MRLIVNISSQFRGMCVNQGYYRIVEVGSCFQEKKLQINPKSKLSLQEHKKRNEHCIVVTGEAKVTLANKVYIMNTNQSIYIPKNTKHRLENNIEDIYGRE